VHDDGNIVLVMSIFDLDPFAKVPELGCSQDVRLQSEFGISISFHYLTNSILKGHLPSSETQPWSLPTFPKKPSTTPENTTNVPNTSTNGFQLLGVVGGRLSVTPNTDALYPHFFISITFRP
jgi:hypothetical protein